MYSVPLARNINVHVACYGAGDYMQAVQLEYSM